MSFGRLRTFMLKKTKKNIFLSFSRERKKRTKKTITSPVRENEPHKGTRQAAASCRHIADPPYHAATYLIPGGAPRQKPRLTMLTHG